MAWRSVLHVKQRDADLGPALTSLIRLQEPEFEGGVGFSLERVRTRDGGIVWLVCYEAARHAETPAYEEYGGDFWSHDFFQHRLLFDGGRLLRPAIAFFTQQLSIPAITS